MRVATIFGVGVACASLVDLPAKWPTPNGKEVQLLGHRGLKSQMPEHTLGSYWLAATAGADYVEPDVVLTKDNVPVCFHNLYIRDGTDVEKFAKFSSRRRNFTGELDGKPTTIENEYFISDFTVAELKELRVVQKEVGVRPQYFNELFQIPTLEEFLEEMVTAADKLGRPINIAPELKHPVYHNSLFPCVRFEDHVLQVLQRHGYALKRNHRPRKGRGKLMLQSFDFESLKYLRTKVDLGVVDLVMLNDDDPYFFTRAGLEELSKHANWLGPWKEYLYLNPKEQFDGSKTKYNSSQVDEWGGFLSKCEVVRIAHRLGLKIVLYTFYDSREKSQRGCAIGCESEDARAEYTYYFSMGIDALFVENIGEAIQARTEYNTKLWARIAPELTCPSRFY
ncbi:hypothetical protein DSO57_1034933 [Entomophthora muscae]|uniref:Uncharacterized protein n=1 Tax=Entomophthora muscae TaxID=34485 RepID=A0ACC2SPH0_9FUNG|nr:hypothetical protein DSO57_1034933 [Entomophthora muscae]